MRGLDRLLRPRSIAVIGGGAWCANVIEQCGKIGFDGPIWPVHPTRRTVGGRPALARIKDLPEAPDAAFIGINRTGTIEAVHALAKMGAGGAVCFASGFREAQAETGDGADLQDALCAAAGDMCILGPNCYGVLNLLDGAALWPDQHGAVPVDRGVALVTQSSNIAINLTMQHRGLPLAYVVTAGNQAQTDLAEIGMGLIEDSRVTALGLHIEGIQDLRALETLAARARDLGKPIVVLKIGASDQARAATVSHTASLAGSGAGARALFDRLGIGQVSALEDLIETLKLLHVAGPLVSNRVASMSCSGGEASLMADSAIGIDVNFPPLGAEQEAALRAALGPRVALANPLDYHTYIWGDRAAMTRCFSAMMAGDVAIGCVVLDFPRADRCDAREWTVVIDAVADAMVDTGKPMAIMASLPDALPEEIAQQIMARGIVPLSGLRAGLTAIAVAAGQGGSRTDSAPVLLPGADQPTRILSEVEAKEDLEGYGLDTPHARRASSVDSAVAQAEALGYPVVLKAEGVAHKTEAGGVAINLDGPDAVRAAATRMAASTYLVEEMITGAIAELLIGVVRDPAHGFVLTLGAGGVLAELVADTVSLMVPADASVIAGALDQLRMAPLLAGYRGASGTDRTALIDAVMAVQAYVCDNAGTLAELEVNPLIVTPSRAVAADALIRKGE